MHLVKAKGISSAHNGMNIYRGCTHGCIYCDSRSKCYQMNHDFEDIEVKENAPELLEMALRKKKKKCMIGTGSMCDPYIPLEMELKNMRRCLEIIEKYGFGVSIITKSDRILRDLDLFIQIHQKAKCVIQMTLTTYDEQLCKIIEPHAATTQRRFEVLKIFRDHGIPTVVWLDPILPFINDTIENINGILDYCIEAQVKGIVCFNMGLTLREGNREYFYEQLDRYFPGIKKRYIQKYGERYEINSPMNKQLMEIFQKRCQEAGILYKVDEVFAYVSSFDEIKQEQLSLFD